jgi:hypothetical protein
MKIEKRDNSGCPSGIADTCRPSGVDEMRRELRARVGPGFTFFVLIPK